MLLIARDKQRECHKWLKAALKERKIKCGLAIQGKEKRTFGGRNV